MDPTNIWIDGLVVPASGHHLSAFDRGFQLGDGVFETLRAHGSHPTELPEHIERLRRSAEGLGIDLPVDLEAVLARAVTDLLDAEGLGGPSGDASLRITVTRGPYRGRGLLPGNEDVPATIVVQAWPVPPPPPGHLERGLHLVTSAVRRDPENPLVALKTTSRADYVYARLEARRAGADDALFLTVDGFLSEATSANLFLVRDGRLRTPALGCAILPGTTRSWILRWGSELGLGPDEGWLTSSDLAAADEAFVCSSVAGILPVTRFDDRPIGDGRPGPWSVRARADREAFIAGGGAVSGSAPAAAEGQIA